MKENKQKHTGSIPHRKVKEFVLFHKNSTVRGKRKRKIYEANFYLILTIQWEKQERQFSAVLL